MPGKKNIATGFLFLAAFMIYGFVLIYLRDFSPGKEAWIAEYSVGKHFESRLAHVHGNLFALINIALGFTIPRLALGDNVSRFGWPDDYPSERLAVLAGLTTLDVRALAQRHWRPAELSILVVGDRERVRAPLETLGEALGRGPVCELDAFGNPLG